jgi:precorrin-6B methylase 2
MTGETLLALGRSFMESRILLTAAELDVFTLLVAAPRSAAEVARDLSGDERAVTILLDALTAMELLHKRAGRYECPPDLIPLLSSRSPQSILPMLLHYVGLWERWSALTALARGDQSAQAALGAPGNQTRLEAFIGAMHVVAGPLAAEVVAAIGAGDARTLLDIGGASGSYTLAFLAAAPKLRATLFDRPAVIEMARPRCAALGERVQFVAGDFDQDELPAGHDLALLSAIIHQNSQAENVALYRKIARALVPGGRLVIRDHVMNADRTTPRAGAIFAVNMLTGTRGGNVYTFEECRAALTEAGFERARLIHPGDQRMNGLIEAFTPRE